MKVSIIKYGLGIFIDMREAFDTISHGALIRKRKIYGIRGIVTNWFESYLSNRRQCVKIDSLSLIHI